MQYPTISNFIQLNLNAYQFLSLVSDYFVNSITNPCCSNVSSVARQPHLSLSTYSSPLTLMYTVYFKDFPTETTLMCHLQQHKLLSPVHSQLQF